MFLCRFGKSFLRIFRIILVFIASYRYLVSGRNSSHCGLRFFLNTTYGRAKNIEKLSIQYHLYSTNKSECTNRQSINNDVVGFLNHCYDDEDLVDVMSCLKYELFSHSYICWSNEEGSCVIFILSFYSKQHYLQIGDKLLFLP